MRLDGKCAVVTGGSKGMGLGIARRFVAEGARVLIVAIDDESLAEAAAEIGSEALATFRGDVSVGSDMAAMAADAVERFGGVDVLVNSAGIQRYGTVVDTDEAVWDEVMGTNLKGVFLASKHVIPHIIARGGGAVINIASVQAFASQANVAAYTATKGAIVALTRAMALDHAGQGVRINAICPASVDTPMLRWAADLWKGDGTAEETLAAWGRAHPMGRVGTVEEVAALGAFLASDECPFMTGADLKLDGGALAKLGIVLPE